MVTVTFDVHPAKVTLPDGRVYTATRVLVADDRLLMYVDPANRAEDPPLMFQSDAISVEGGGYNGWSILTEEGLVDVLGEGGCGCGSRLKNWTPFAQMTRGPRPVLSPP